MSTSNTMRSESEGKPKGGPLIEPPEEVLSTMNKDGSRRWIYPKQSPGKFLNWRRVVGWTLIVLFFALPLIQINGEPAMWLDFVHRRFALFGGVFYATDTLLLMLLGLTLVIGVVWFTALFGRVWCGWACPQTVYMEFIFRPIDRLIEGKESKRKRRDEGPWVWDKIWRKGARLVIYTVIAAAMSHTFVAYFVSWDQLLEWMTGPPAEHWGFFLMMALTTALIVFDFAYFREQMCTITCPYARLQSVLMDPNSLIVSYDSSRGEPRGRRNKKQREQEKEGIELNLGDCIDCGACVRTCPTGIDIRDGLQLECISCTQCIDACDAIMIGVGKEPGLVRYTSENEIAGKETKIIRPRLIIYTAILVILSGLLAFNISNTGGFDVDVIRAPGAPFVKLPDGNITNRLRIRTQNRTGETRTVKIELVEPESGKLNVVGQPEAELKAGQMRRVDAWVVVPAEAFGGERQLDVKLRIGDGSEFDQVVKYHLLGPENASGK